MRLTIAFLSLLFASVAEARSSHVRDVSAAVRVLRAGEPHGVTWRYSQHVDLNGDGERDEVFISSASDRFYVAVVLGPISAASVSSVVSWNRDANSHDGICGVFESLTPERLAKRHDLVEMIGEVPAGHPYAAAARGLRLVAGECDSFHLFWNSSAAALDWWRL